MQTPQSSGTESSLSASLFDSPVLRPTELMPMQVSALRLSGRYILKCLIQPLDRCIPGKVWNSIPNWNHAGFMSIMW